MGDAKRKRLSQARLLESEPRCIYCLTTSPLTLEHMPGIAMFRDRVRPNDMEFAACGACNQGSRGADALAAFLSRIRQEEKSLTDWELVEGRKYLSGVAAHAQAALQEIFNPANTTVQQVWTKRGVLKPAVGVTTGPAVHAYMSVYGAKMGMALFRKHTGHALPDGGVVWSQFFLNAAMTQQMMDSTLSIMPMFQTLRQGAKDSAGQFGYRYNSDDKSVVAALSSFHDALWIVNVASSTPDIINLMSQPKFVDMRNASITQPGQLLDRLHAYNTR